MPWIRRDKCPDFKKYETRRDFIDKIDYKIIDILGCIAIVLIGGFIIMSFVIGLYVETKFIYNLF